MFDCRCLTVGVWLSVFDFARCVTPSPQNCDVYLIDDVFASLDAHVAAHVLEHGVCGVLAGKTRLLVGHYLPAVQRAATLVTMRGGAIAYLGPPQEGLDSISDELRGVRWPCCTGGLHGCMTVMDAQAARRAALLSADDHADAVAQLDSRYAEGHDTHAHTHRLPSAMAEGAEERAVGHVRPAVWLAYVGAMGGTFTAAVLGCLVAMQASRNASDLWLAYWVAHTEPPPAANPGTAWLLLRMDRYEWVRCHACHYV